jgi:2-polyprenyl-3-methyl-5-hydroxy-6-metoxy-1,4-benzoquinol methylase
MMRCEQCDLVVDGSVWQPAANERLNEISFGDNYEPIRSSWVRIFEKLNNRRTMSRLRSVVDAKGIRLLEIGVGSGSFLVYAKAHGYSPLGIDLSAAICNRVEQNTGISMHCGSCESLSDDHLFDVVVMNHVLEHVSDPVALLKAVRARMTPGSILHLAVPNVGAWEARLPGWNSYEPYHLLYFTPRTLRLAVEKAGFEIQHLTTHESFSGWFLAILRTLLMNGHTIQPQQERNTRIKQSKSFMEHAYRLVMVTFGLFTLPFRRLQELLGKGDEVILLARNGAND